jgi:hypothetical protein
VPGWLTSSHLVERAEIAAKQMRYFRLVAQRATFAELGPSAKRAGFIQGHQDIERKEASFRWPTGELDFIFFVSFEDPEAISVTAEAYGDIYGLIMLSHSNLPNISVELKTVLEKHEIGRNAVRFRDILLKFPDFDGGIEEMHRRLGLQF